MEQQDMFESTKVKMTEKELFDRLKNLYGEIDLLNTDVKELTAEAKDNDITTDRIKYIKKVAKYVAEVSLQSKEEDAQTFLEVCKEFS